MGGGLKFTQCQKGGFGGGGGLWQLQGASFGLSAKEGGMRRGLSHGSGYKGLGINYRQGGTRVLTMLKVWGGGGGVAKGRDANSFGPDIF